MCKSSTKEVSFKWTHFRILSTDLKFRATFYIIISIIDSGSDRVQNILQITFTI